MFRSKNEIIPPEDALAGRSEALPESDVHFVNGTSLYPPFPEGTEQAMFAMGCFWGAERIFWQIPGVYTTAAGYAGGYTPNPTYEEVCTTRTGHAEVALVVFDPKQVSYERLLKDAIDGDQTLFVRDDEAEAAWEWVDPILGGWSHSEKPVQSYKRGSWGPKPAATLMTRGGHHRSWHDGPDEDG